MASANTVLDAPIAWVQNDALDPGNVHRRKPVAIREYIEALEQALCSSREGLEKLEEIQLACGIRKAL